MVGKTTGMKRMLSDGHLGLDCGSLRGADTIGSSVLAI